MTSQIPPHSLELVTDVQVDEERLLAAGGSDATSPSSVLMTSQKSDNPALAVSFDDFSWFSFDEFPRDSFEQTDARSLASSATDSAASAVAIAERETLSTFLWDSSREAPMLGFPPEQMDNLQRYYNGALSDDDIAALIRGKKNHNLKKWSPEETVKYHEARKSLIPLVMPKVEKMSALADIEHDKQYSQRAVNHRVRPAFRLPCIKVTDHNKENGEATSSPRSSRSSPSSPMKSHSNSSPLFTCDGESLQCSSLHLHTRAVSGGDYFSHRRRISPLASSSGPSSESSTRVRSPLAQEVQFRLNPETTFDSFLVPHKSGKCDILPGVANVKKPKSRKLSKMPSMPLLRKRGQLD
ncbi:uncharacterized protein yc1106_08263 [Curvularia clavata]|uniref:Uncharacterized protein n=1 Tax=Curvularia clavata TaxID=95742 RepID=A0A9Q8ZGE6_CURCL|nr:uncharacterized protein yc1106_08263 [Curvularia clavata]